MTLQSERSLRPSESKDVGRCPVTHTDYRLERPVLENYQLLNAEREDARFSWNDSTDHGFWMVNRYDDVVEAIRMFDTFSNRQVNAFVNDMAVPLLPNSLDPPEHTQMRRMLNPFFSPAAVKRMEPLARERARSMIADLAPRGGDDLTTGFALLYPTELFLALLGLPVEDGPEFLPRVEAVFGGFFKAGNASPEEAEAAAAWITSYFDAKVDERLANPGDPAVDLLTRVLQTPVGEEKLAREEVLNLMMTLMLAGLDTTRSALGYMFMHLARDVDLRHQLTAEPALWPRFIEEAVRLYSLIIEDGRIATRDVDFHGVDVRQGDMLWLGLAAANRDPRKFSDPDRFDMDRPDLNHHLGFGAGQHRCIGMHLARAELVIALEEWHAAIPEYRIADGAQLRERGGQLKLVSLPLEWD
ncbi:MAG TPA: cytochrome P450 [Nocardioides sp.]|nr:cytochrome P450 [Nocardioides sp.]